MNDLKKISIIMFAIMAMFWMILSTFLLYNSVDKSVVFIVVGAIMLLLSMIAISEMG